MTNIFKRFYTSNTALILALALASFLSCLLAISCSSSAVTFTTTTLNQVDQITTTRLGRLDPIVVRFIEPIEKPESIRKAVCLSPNIQGTWTIRDERTMEFTPDSPYKGGSTFSLAIDTGILKGRASRAEGFSINFSVRPTEYEVITDGLYTDETNPDFFTFSGTLSTDIPVSVSTSAQIISARIGTKAESKEITIQWNEQEKSNTHRFSISGISRTNIDQTLTLSWKGKALDSKYEGKQAFLVPQKQDFRVLEIATKDPSCITVRFSDKIDPTQDIRGLIKSANSAGMRYNLDGNILKLYNIDGWKTDSDITVLEGIKSATGKVLMIPTSVQINSAWEIPEVRFANDGVILPTTSGVIVPVETKNLKGLIVEAYLIYGDNILQFLQVNELDGSNEMMRVGEPVWSSAFEFDWDDSMKNRYVPRGLDLSTLIKKNPGAMIQLRLTFRKRHIMYVCPASHDDFSSLPMPSDEITADRNSGEQSYWNYFDNMDWKTRETYWNFREDPCHPAFYLSSYNSKILVRKNVLVSNLAIMNKLDTDGTYHVTIADIGSALPVEGALVSLYTYAQKLVASEKTDAKGFVNLKSTAEPYFITATKNGQISYLRIESGAALSVSHFPVDGEEAVKGVKGFIYGERGVWRPGDTIHLVFILQDLKKQFPANFPVTFELQDPQGRIAQTGVYSNPVDGFYRIDTKTNSEDPTGPWIARVKAGGQTWTRTLKIESIVPNRLSVNLKIEKPYLVASGNNFTLTGAWLHGAKAPGLKADVSVMFTPGTTNFDGYSEYTFTNPERSIESNRETVWEGNLDDNSTAEFSLDLSAGENLPGKLKAQLITRIFEPSEMFSVEQTTYDYSPYDRYVGLKVPKGDADRNMLLTDTKHRVEIALLTAEGKPVTNDVAVSVSMYKLDWRWWWEKDALTDASYVSDRSTNLVTSAQVKAKKGKAIWDFEIKSPEWGRYLIVAEDSSGGHSAAKIIYIDWPGWAGRGNEEGSGSAAMLTLAQDKKSYLSGETALVSFSSGEKARALITVEKDGSIIAQDWLETSAGTTLYKLPLTPAMAPNVYVHVTLIQKHMQTANSLPIRLYGVIPLMVENPNTRLSPIIVAPAQYEPGKKAALTVTESSGRPMTFTVAVVDEGLLGLTRYTAQNPWKEFYKKEASRLQSWDIYKYVMSAFGGKLETLLSIGGSEDALNANNKKAQRFVPVVQFFGPYELPAKGKSDISFDMSQYVGAVRIMVVAGKDGAYGTAEQTVAVRSDLMVQSTLPRSLGVNETIEVPITLFNGKDSAQEVAVSLTSEGAITTQISQTASVAPLSEKTIRFRLVTDRAGKAVITVKATGSVTAEDRTEIDIVSRGSPLINGKKFTLLAGEKFNEPIDSPGEKGTKTLSVELSTLPVLDLNRRLKYLIEYPHGCIEQITSGAFPQLFIAEMTDTSASEKETIKKNVMSVIDRYQRYQTSSGGFAYWIGNKEDSLWGTNYAGHFMIEARKQGYEVPDSMFKPWLAFQQGKARAYDRDEKEGDAIQAYRLYTLALAGYPELGGMNRLSTVQDISDSTRWLLAGTYALSGHTQTATEMTQNTDLTPSSYRETSGTWGSNFRDSAIILNTLTLLQDSKRIASILPVIAENFASEHWFSTQETAWMLLSLSPHYRMSDKQNARYSLDSSSGSEKGEIKRSSVIRNLSATETDVQNISVTNIGTKTLYGKVTARALIPAGKEKKIEKGIGATIQYIDSNGRVMKVADLVTGTSFTVRITIHNKSNEKVDNIALSLPVPTCWEFENTRVGAIDENSAHETDSDNSEEAIVSPLYDYRDIRDDIINTYFSLESNESKVFEFHATVAYKGSYYIPALHAEAMYDSEYQAVVPGQFVTLLTLKSTR